MISFIVPAHNEQGGLARTLQAIHDSAGAMGESYEIIVVNDASTDDTPKIALHYKARVLNVNHRQIAATRNAGGRAALGERLFFVDADTILNPDALGEALDYLDAGAVGGGGPTLFDGVLPLYIRLIARLGVIGAKLIGFTGGALMFATRAAFQASGGFDERLFWAEEGSFAFALKRLGRFVVLWKPVITSSRRIRALSGQTSWLPALRFVARLLISPFQMMTQRSSVAKIWYDSNREADKDLVVTRTARVSNALLLFIVIVLVTGPVWYFIPHAWTPWASPQGIFRLVARFICAHVGLIFWPFGLVLLWNLRRRMNRIEWAKMAVLCALCFWQAWESTRGVLWLWTGFGKWVAHFW